jgi:hypothetical protein
MTSQHTDVRAGAATELMHTASQAAVDILITGLNDPDPELHNTIRSILNFKIGQEFDTYEQAIQWWNANRSLYNDDLTLKNVSQ